MKDASKCGLRHPEKVALKHSVLILAALVATVGSASASSDGVSCVRGIDPESQLDRLPDCMRMGRHVRVGQSVSRGTATLGGGYVNTGLSDNPSESRRLNPPPNPLTILPSIFFGR